MAHLYKQTYPFHICNTNLFQMNRLPNSDMENILPILKYYHSCIQTDIQHQKFLLSAFQYHLYISSTLYHHYHLHQNHNNRHTENTTIYTYQNHNSDASCILYCFPSKCCQAHLSYFLYQFQILQDLFSTLKHSQQV